MMKRQNDGNYYCLYKITNLSNNKFYIGVHKTKDLSDGYMGSGIQLNRQYEKYGTTNFIKEYLEFFENYESLLQREAEIVNEDFLKRKDVYNIALGGNGGWFHINEGKYRDQKHKWVKKGAKKAGQILKDLWDNSPEKREKMLEYGKMGRERAREYWLGNTHSEESKNKMSATHKKNKLQQGKNNSNYGKMWISNIESKEIMSVPNTQEIPEGWIRGRNTWNNLRNCRMCNTEFLRAYEDYHYDFFENSGYKAHNSELYCSDTCTQDSIKQHSVRSKQPRVTFKHCPNGITQYHLSIVKEFLRSPCLNVNDFYTSSFNTKCVSHMTIHNALKNFDIYERSKKSQTEFCKKTFMMLLGS